MNTKRGFTLIELLVVIAIIGILSAVVLASLNSAREKSRDARRISDVKQLQLALELYFDASTTYPVGTDLQPVVASGYIATLPKDPSTGNGYTYQAMDSGGSACSSSPCVDYVLGANLEDNGHTVLGSDIDGTVGGIDCDDPGAGGPDYCIRP